MLQPRREQSRVRGPGTKGGPARSTAVPQTAEGVTGAWRVLTQMGTAWCLWVDGVVEGASRGRKPSAEPTQRLSGNRTRRV